ncbi:aminotransferase class III-fold pyridoxal phosphate-dependent enzyme [Paenibacillus hemerocallicola]|uniref:Aminotransferase class III-fold pyridoxal phosphate-dependent enzyme n=1 Tax=Paenibacillus hemerocallicola TaxID=1172614 RepID=A0A5C4T6L1_9BACL|nr:aminotransferase class III-fold pyridoxal phosphate-dependent enzyme [Paenibacillus hemerocallicola]TNJ64466.1 aminotransferase class III-fold pyridoxal phosphate-dependent enzyme [Paenibacillus hemerocallicola]
MPNEQLTHSQRWTERLNASIPWGSSTGSKAPQYAPEEPGVIVRGDGCRVWDADGRDYIDFRNGLGPVTLGYRYPAVNEAIREQLEHGIVFGHPHPLEGEVAEMFCELVPCAEQARFLKTGGEAIAATIRLARAFTGRDHIVQIGYNGWLNGLAVGGATLPDRTTAVLPGVPHALSALHHACRWNDIAGLEKLFAEYDGRIAAVIVAANYPDMEAGHAFYPALRELTAKHGSLLVYDEIVTGFRIAIGGAQQYFGVVPDLAVFSKGIANGMPLSVYAGKQEIMSCCAPGKVSISSTFGGETLSLAAAKACMNVYKQQDVVGFLWKQGEAMWGGLQRLFEQYGVPIALRGFWPCPSLAGQGVEGAAALKRFFRLAYKHGVSMYNTSYVNFSHRDEHIEEALNRLDRACKEYTETMEGEAK